MAVSGHPARLLFGLLPSREPLQYICPAGSEDFSFDIFVRNVVVERFSLAKNSSRSRVYVTANMDNQLV